MIPLNREAHAIYSRVVCDQKGEYIFVCSPDRILLVIIMCERLFDYIIILFSYILPRRVKSRSDLGL